MEKVIINPKRMEWCLESLGIDIPILSEDLKIGQKTLKTAMEGEPAFTMKQLGKVAKYFNKSMLFFINQREVEEEKILSPQFRTINNKRPLHSRKLRKLVEIVENHRNIYLELLKDLEERYKDDWYPYDLELDTGDLEITAERIRSWLNIPEEINFKELRKLVESKEIIVIVSNGFNGVWQIDKRSPVRGFSLYFDSLPVIVIKKQTDGAQAFTLFHELAHLLLHKNSVMDYEEDYQSNTGLEKEANELTGNILIPYSYLLKIDTGLLITMESNEIDDYLDEYSRKWCVSNEAILVRLIQNKEIEYPFYSAYRNFKEYLFRRSLENTQQQSIPRTYRHREPLNIFGKSYVMTVLEAFHNQHITLAKASSFLDNLKIKDVHKLEKYVIQL